MIYLVLFPLAFCSVFYAFYLSDYSPWILICVVSVFVAYYVALYCACIVLRDLTEGMVFYV